MFLRSGECVERAKVGVEAKHAFESRAQRRIEFARRMRRKSGDPQARTRGGANLLHGDFDRLWRTVFIERERAPVGVAVPAVEDVFRAASQGPHGEVKAKRRKRAQREGESLRRTRIELAWRSVGEFCRRIAPFARHVAIIYRECACAQMRRTELIARW